MTKRANKRKGLTVVKYTVTREMLLLEQACNAVKPAHGKCWSCGLWAGHSVDCKTRILNAKRYL